MNLGVVAASWKTKQHGLATAHKSNEATVACMDLMWEGRYVWERFKERRKQYHVDKQEKYDFFSRKDLLFKQE